MDVEVTTPQDHVGDVVGDLNRRRGQIQNQESSGSTIIVRALVPLEEMFGYISHLRSIDKEPPPRLPCSSTTTIRCRVTSPTRS